jgi:predicted Zn-dependent protease
LFGKNVSLFSDPLHPEAPCPTHVHGLPLTRTNWVEAGVLKHLHESRFWAAKNGRPPLPSPGNLILQGEDASPEALSGAVDDGVLITRLWYIRMVEPQTLLHTGLTRDGTFAIKNGKVAGPVRNFRFNESPVNLLRQIVASGRRERVLGSENAMPMSVPALLVEDFNLSSVSEAT